MCGTDGHIHEGEFISKFPLIPGHESVGTVVEVGKNVKDFKVGDRCVADVGITVNTFFSFLISVCLPRFQCEHCFYCRRGQSLLCENFNSRGVTQDGAFAEYVA